MIKINESNITYALVNLTIYGKLNVSRRSAYEPNTSADRDESSMYVLNEKVATASLPSSAIALKLT